jgi:hypothetical protein
MALPWFDEPPERPRQGRAQNRASPGSGKIAASAQLLNGLCAAPNGCTRELNMDHMKRDT